MQSGTWVIDAEPHVMIRAKRLFSGSHVRAEQVRVSHTGENAVDLLWFMERFPLEIDERERRFMASAASEALKRVEDTHALLSGARKVAPARALEKPLRPYQETAVGFWQINPRCLCADDLGVGKTVQAIGGVAQGLTPAAVVVPTHIQRQWKAKFAEFAPWLNVHIARKGKPYKLPQFANGLELRGNRTGERCHVLVLNYHKLAGWAPFLGEWANAIIYDEVHNLSSRGSGDKTSLKYDAACLLARGTHPILGMSNTPIRNYGGEMYNVLTVLGLHKHIGSREEFKREWCKEAYGNGEPPLKSPEAFVSWLKDAGLMLRRTARDCGLPVHEPEVIPFEVDSDPAALEAVNDAAEELARLILREGESRRGEKMQAASDLDWRLRQATGIAKAPYVAELVRIIVESGEKVVVGVWHREVYTILENRLQGIRCARYSGSESPAQKEAAKAEFCKGGAQVLLLSNRSGEGLDGLQYASHIGVFAELDWSWTAHKQFMGRLARDGQQHRVLFYFPHTDDGSDPVMVQTLGIKRDQGERLINPEAPAVEMMQVDKDHIRSLAMNWLERKGKLEVVNA